MEQQIIFRDYQEQQAQDHTDLQDFAQEALDHIVVDAVTSTRRYSGFNTQKTTQTEVQASPGRFYDTDGAVYHYDTTLVQSMVQYLPSTAKRYVVLTAYGTVVETDQETRDYLINVSTNLTEPKSVTTVRSRDVVLGFTVGTESADPQVPVISATSVAIAKILLSSTQVESVTMLPENAVTSTEDLDLRTDELEDFMSEIGPRVASLASDLAALAEALKKKAQVIDMSNVYQDLARVKERVELPATYSDYGADRFLDPNDSDADNSQSLGYSALVQEGVRFKYAATDEFEPNIFSANDPNAHLSSGLLLPAFADELKLEIGPFHTELGIAQYGFQTFDIVQYTVARWRIRYGGWFQVCTNMWWAMSGTWQPVGQQLKYDFIQHTFLFEGETYEWENVADQLVEAGGITHMFRARKIWTDHWTENYWKTIKVDHSVSGAQVAQTVLVANDTWLTKVGLYFTVKAANEAVYLTLTEITTGQPDLTKALLHQTIAHGDILSNQWTEVSVQPTFLKGGKRYALVVTSNANHKVGLAYGQTYVDGTFFYSTDSEYYMGDLTKDLMLRLYGAKFNAPQVTIELTALSLSGGIRDVDIMAGMVVPDSTQLIYEAQPGGSGAWLPLTVDDTTAFDANPPLARFRARFVGTRDMQPAIMLTGSRVTMFRPDVTFVHVSEVQTLGSPSSEIYVKVILENFNDTPHDMACRLYYGAAYHDPISTTTTDIDAAEKRYYRTFKFTPSEISSFTIELTGSTNSATDVFHVAERIYWAL